MSHDPRTLAPVRRAVRAAVDDTPELAAHPDLRNRLARSLVSIGLTAAELAAPEPASAPLATGQGAVDRAPKAVQELREALDFPGFVTGLITGVFNAMSTSSLQQLEAISDLLSAVSRTTDDFDRTQLGADAAHAWIVGRYPVQVEPSTSGPARLVLRKGQELPESAAIARDLDVPEEEASAIDEDDLAGTLVPLVRRKLARDRQRVLATLIQLGLQRVVVDSGKIHASMNMRVEANEELEKLRRKQQDAGVSTAASGKFSAGMWGASASVKAHYRVIEDEQDWRREQIKADAGLRSSVDVQFRTVPVDLGSIADPSVVKKVQQHAPAALVSGGTGVAAGEFDTKGTLGVRRSKLDEGPLKGVADTEDASRAVAPPAELAPKKDAPAKKKVGHPWRRGTTRESSWSH